jgi:phosphoglycerate dehydrogenase-like enzyme
MRVVIPDDWNGVFETAPEIARLRQRADVIVHRVRPANLLDIVKDADIAVAARERTRYDAALLAGMPNLKLIVSVGGNWNPSIDKDFATSRGVLVCNTAGQLGEPRPPAPQPQGTPAMTEMALGMMISVMRQFGEQDRAMRAGEWPAPRGRVLYGKTLGIVGLGRLGSDLARVAQYLGMRVIAAGVTLTPERAAAAGVEFRSLDDLFAESDVISVHVRLTDTTRGLVNARLIGRMKPNAVLLNTSRGPVVEEAALVEALQQQRIGGAALDVYDEEPLPADHPLRRTEHTLLLAHCGWPTDEAFAQIIPATVRVIEAFLDGAPINVENPPPAASAQR